LILAVQVPTPYIQGGLCIRASNRDIPLKGGYVFDIGSSSVKQLQIGTDMLFIITSTCDKLLVVLTSMTLNDL